MIKMAVAQTFGKATGLLDSPLRQWIVAMTLKSVFGISFRFGVADEDESHRSKHPDDG